MQHTGYICAKKFTMLWLSSATSAPILMFVLSIHPPIQEMILVGVIVSYGFACKSSSGHLGKQHCRPGRELQQLVKEWEAHRPRTFEVILDLPGYLSPSDWNAELWYSHNEHGLPLFNYISVSVLKVLHAVDATEYLLIAKLILKIHDPTIPKMGFRVQSAAVNVQVNILFYSIGCTGQQIGHTDMPLKEMTQEYIRKVCIIAKCTKFIPGKFLACNALFACKPTKQPKSKQAEFLCMRTLT